MFAEVEGNNESVQEALRTMVSAMGRPVRIVSAKTIDDTPALAQQELAGEIVEDVFGDEIPEAEQMDPPSKGARKQRAASARDRNAGITIVPDLNFRPDKQPTLREFFAEKAPSSDMEEILVVVYFMQNLMKVTKISGGHIRTALGDVGKGIPLDLRQTVRNMRNRKAWVKYTDVDDISVATAGENHVLHDMGKKG